MTDEPKSWGGAIWQAANRNKDSRTKTYRKAFTPHALVYQEALTRIRKTHTILDYGCGKDAYWSNRLGSQGYTIDGIDLSRPDLTAHGEYDMVLISNVINVQHTILELDDTLTDILQHVAIGSTLIWNYPASPRKLPFSNKEMTAHVLDRIWQEGYNHEDETGTGSHRGVHVTKLI